MSKIVKWFKNTTFYDILIAESSKGESAELKNMKKEVEEKESELLRIMNSSKDPNSKGAPNPKGGGQIQLSNMQTQPPKQTNIEQVKEMEGR